MFSLLLLQQDCPTFDTGGGAAAPGQVPLAGDDVRAADVVARLALIGQHAAPHGEGVGRADPAKRNFGEGRASVVRLHLCGEQTGRRAVKPGSSYQQDK